jgi:[ribosomal protein S18]-alanine N-acetyltransferase
MFTLTRYQLRPMTEADVPQVAEIEAQSFPTTWPRTAYRRELSNRLARYLVLVDRSYAHEAPADEEQEPERKSLFDFLRRKPASNATSDYVVGYIGVWLMVDQAHIVAIAVREDYRRQGLGELLLSESIDLALANGQESVTLEVRRSNESAQALYEKYRFIKVGVRRRYYTDNKEDALIMTTPPINTDSYVEHLAYLHDRWERRWAQDATG